MYDNSFVFPLFYVFSFVLYSLLNYIQSHKYIEMILDIRTKKSIVHFICSFRKYCSILFDYLR